MEQKQTHLSRQIYLLGSLRVFQGEILSPLGGEKSQSLLSYLALNPHLPHRREKLADLLFPDTPPDRVRRSFSDALYRLQKALGSDWLVIQGDTISLRVNEQLWVDIWEFELLAASNLEADLKKAADLYTGDLLPELYDDWLLPERELRRNHYLSALEKLAALQEKRGDLRLALLTLRRLVLAEPLHEPAHQAYLRLLGRLQRFGEALVHYEYVRNLMQSELGAEPLAETSLIAQSIEKERGLATVPVVVEEQVPFVGRKAERAAVLTVVEKMLKGQGGILAIEGEAGIGKSRLVREIAASVRWRGATLLQGGASETPSASPFSPLAEALAPLIHSPRGLQLESLLSGEILAALAPLNPAWSDRAILADVPPELAGNRFYDALLTYSQSLMQLTPLVLALDDLQWADATLWKSIEVLGQSLARGGALFIAIYRRPDIEQTPGWQIIQDWDRDNLLKSITLPPLNVEEVAQLVSGAHPNDPAEVHAWTGGNPFYISEWLAAPELDRTTPKNNMLLRLQALSSTARLALESACVLGENIPYRMWTEIAELPSITLADISDELMTNCWLQPTPSGYAFTHDLIRNAVYADIDPARRRDLHEHAARVYTALEPDNLRTQAFHLDQAGLKSEAVAIYRRAGEQDMARFAFHEAARAFARVLILLPSGLTPDRVEIDLSLVRAYEITGNRAQQLPLVDEAVEGARQLGKGDLLLQALLAKAQTTIRINQNALAASCLEEALALAQQLQDTQSETEVMLLLATNETNLLHSEDAKTHYAYALKLAQKTTDLTRQARALRGLGITARDLDAPRESIKWLEDASAIQRKIGDRLGDIFTHANLITAYYDLAAWDRVLAIANEVLSEAEELSVRSVVAYARQLHALACYSLGDYHTAREEFMLVAKDFKAVGDCRGEGLTYCSLGLIAEEEGKNEEAMQFYQTSLAMISSIVGATETSIVQHDLGVLLLKLGRPAEAIPLLEAACSGEVGGGNELSQLNAGAHLGLALLAVGERTRAEKLAENNWDAFQTGIPIGEQPQRWLWALYRLLKKMEQHDSAQIVLTSANAELTRQARAISNEDLRRSFFERVRIHRAIIETYDHLNQTSRVITITLAQRNAPLGRTLREDERITVQWTISAPEDEAIADKTARRQYQLKRLLQQAENQNGAPTDEDLAQALGVSRRTIVRDMKALAQEFPRPPTRKRKG